MTLAFIVLTFLSLAVALFALQNADVVTIKFWPWQFQASVAIVTLGATATGAVMAGLLGLATRFRRWTRTRAGAPAPREPGAAHDTRPPAGPPPRPNP